MVLPIAFITNNCTDCKKHFPDQWKITTICPIPKVKIPTSTADFRLIFVPPILFKICVQKIVCTKKCANLLKTTFYIANIGFDDRKHD